MGPFERGLVTEDDTLARGRRPGQSPGDFWIVRPTRRPAPAHPFYEPRNQILAAAGFDRFCAAACEKFYAAKLGRPSLPPGMYFRRLRIGSFETRDRERQIAWRGADSLSWRAFLGCEPDPATPDPASLSRTCHRIDLETHEVLFHGVLKRRAAGTGRQHEGSGRGHEVDRAARRLAGETLAPPT